jgi:hypothetical protein
MPHSGRVLWLPRSCSIVSNRCNALAAHNRLLLSCIEFAASFLCRKRIRPVMLSANSVHCITRRDSWHTLRENGQLRLPVGVNDLV